MIWCENTSEEEISDTNAEYNSHSEIINIFYQIYKIVQIDHEHSGDIDGVFQNYVYNNILYVYEK